MTRFVPVLEGAADSTVPTGAQVNVKWTVTGPQGYRAVFNDPNDADYVGVLSEVSGFDAADVRESADDLVGLDGGIHGDFFRGRRPVTLSGLILNPVSTYDRNLRMTRLQRACDALRKDATITWSPDGGLESFVSVRLQNGPRFTGGWQKEFHVQMVAADPRIYSTLRDTAYVTTQSNITNVGTAVSYPILTIRGPGVNPVVSNMTNGGVLRFNRTLATGDTITIDTWNRTIVNGSNVNIYSSLDFLTSTWVGLESGVNDIRLAWTSGSTAASQVTVDWRHAWL